MKRRRIRKIIKSVWSKAVFVCLLFFLLVCLYLIHDVKADVAINSDGDLTTEGIATEDLILDHAGMGITRSVPVLHIHLHGVTLEEINTHSKNIKYGGNQVSLITENGIYRYMDVQVKGRGNATWGWKKKPYQIKFSENVDLFGMGASRKWVLLANYRDVSLLRNESAFYLANCLDESYVRPGQFVELYVDDDYVGLYYLSHKVEIGSNGVPLEDQMGTLVEIEAVHEPNDIWMHSQYSESCLVLSEAVEDGNEFIRQEALRSFVDAFDRLEGAAVRGDWEAVKREMDVESFARYFLINEFSANPDGFATSFYMYRDGEDDVIHAGPVWDFDMAFGNPKYTSGDASSANRSWAYTDPRDLLQVQEHLVTELFQYLIDFPAFRATVEEQYQTVLRDAIERLPDHLYSMADDIMDAALKDQDVWHTNSTFVDDLDKLTDWIQERRAYMDLLYGSRIHMKDGLYQVYLLPHSMSQDVQKEDIAEERVPDHWYLAEQSDGTYRISDPDTGWVLSLEKEDSIHEYERVTWKEDCGSYGQRWILTAHKNGIALISKLTGLILTFEEETWEMNVQEYEKSVHQIIGVTNVVE